MNFMNFILKALPWADNKFFANLSENGLLDVVMRKLYQIAMETLVGSNKPSFEQILQNEELLKTYQSQSQSIKVEYYKYVNLDRMDARQRDKEINKLQNGNRRADVLIYFAISGICVSVLLLIVCQHYLSFNVEQILSSMNAMLMSCLRDVYIFEFGQETKILS